jgi:hypothetical protein
MQYTESACEEENQVLTNRGRRLIGCVTLFNSSIEMNFDYLK